VETEAESSEDSELMRLLIRADLEAEGIELVEARERSSGSELARAARPDLILLDVELPVLDASLLELIADA
jgi:DNA-binding response OmpR family regulator